MLKSVFIVGPKAIEKYDEIPAAPAIEEFREFEDWQLGIKCT
jgi:hypothetical protein